MGAGPNGGKSHPKRKEQHHRGAAIAMAPELEKWTVDLEKRVADELAQAPPAFVADGSRPVWSIDTPPPYPSGKWHIGAVAGYSLIDVIARSRRMLGYDVLFPWGVDRNGINIEFTVEKKHKKPMQFWDRAEFNGECAQEIKQYSDDMARIGRRIGLSCDFDNGYATDSEEYRAFSQAMFLDLFTKGLIVEDLRPNTFDPKLGTAIADAEVFYEERKTRLNHVTWTVKETGESITISTTRPELICACRAVLVHPDNEATQHLIGKTAVLPVVGGRSLGNSGNEEVPIRAHPHVKADFGSGIMMVCSFGDQADVQLFRELELDPIAAIGMDGKMTEAAGAGDGPEWENGGRPKQDNGQPELIPGLYAGLKVEPARKAIIDDLEAEGLLPEFDKVDQKFPISERSKAAVEMILLKEWYVKQTHATADLRRIAGEIDFHPAKHRQLLLDWIDTVTIDWPISRRRYYHTEIPLWYIVDEEGNETEYIAVPPSDTMEPTYYRPWLEDPPANTHILHRDTREPQGDLEAFLESRRGYRAVGEEKVFDTWMDSSVSNLFILNQYADKPWHHEHTCSIRPQGRDIVRTWLYYTVLKSHLLHDKAAFEHAWIHGMGMDARGRKMSKSVGNVIDPDQILETTGSDAFRLWIAGECTIGDDFRIDEQKIKGAGKFLQKLANVVKFVSQFEAPPDRPSQLTATDEWILGELNAVTGKAVAGYEAIDFFSPANEVRSFVWNLFAPHYLEMVKGRAYEGDPAACWTLHEVVRSVLRLLAPITPFITHYLAKQAYALDIHQAAFPEGDKDAGNQDLTEAVVAFNTLVWKTKKDQGLSLAAGIDGIDIPEELTGMADDFTAMHKLGQEETVEA